MQSQRETTESKILLDFLNLIKGNPDITVNENELIETLQRFPKEAALTGEDLLLLTGNEQCINLWVDRYVPKSAVKHPYKPFFSDTYQMLPYWEKLVNFVLLSGHRNILDKIVQGNDNYAVQKKMGMKTKYTTDENKIIAGRYYPVNLSNHDLTGLDLSHIWFADNLNFQNANLSGANLTGTRFTTKSIYETNLQGATMLATVFPLLNWEIREEERGTIKFKELSSHDIMDMRHSGVDERIGYALLGILYYLTLPRFSKESHLSFISRELDNTRGLVRADQYKKFFESVDTVFKQKVVIYALLSNSSGQTLQKNVLEFLQYETKEEAVKALYISMSIDVGSKEKFNYLLKKIIPFIAKSIPHQWLVFSYAQESPFFAQNALNKLNDFEKELKATKDENLFQHEGNKLQIQAERLSI